jgi:hypoxanthine phosphoribosyltransferase
MSQFALHAFTVVLGGQNSKAHESGSRTEGLRVADFLLARREPAENGWRALKSQKVAPVRSPVPRAWRGELDRVLIREEQISKRVRALAAHIEKDYRGRDLVMVALLNGTVMFLADLIRHLRLPVRLDFIGVSSYGVGTTSGDLIFTKELRLDVKGRDVLLVDDILDTGRTLNRVTATLRALKPRTLKSCVFLNKQARRTEDISADYIGFEIPDFFVVGYGLDFAERYRNLPFVGVLREEIYAGA